MKICLIRRASCQGRMITQPDGSCSAAMVAEGALQTPHGGKLVELLLPTSAAAEAVASCNKTMECSDRNACDVELLTVG